MDIEIVLLRDMKQAQQRNRVPLEKVFRGEGQSFAIDPNMAHSEEVERHAAALQDCAGDTDCVHAENTRHHIRQLEIVRAMQNCKNGCYNEGGGGGGN